MKGSLGMTGENLLVFLSGHVIDFIGDAENSVGLLTTRIEQNDASILVNRIQSTLYRQIQRPALLNTYICRIKPNYYTSHLLMHVA